MQPRDLAKFRFTTLIKPSFGRDIVEQEGNLHKAARVKSG
jgi:hypothetical protein